MNPLRSRRRFLEFVAGAPWLAARATGQTPELVSAGIRDPAEAIDVLDFEAAARSALPPAHFGYLATGVDDDATLKANAEGFRHIRLRPRRLVDVSSASVKAELFGSVWDMPVLIDPVGSQKAFHPEGEVAVARAARSRRAPVLLSTQTTSPIEDVCKAAGQPVWFQLYATSSWEITVKLVRHAEAAGCPVLALTVDLPVGRNTETQERYKRLDQRACAACHPREPSAGFRRKPMYNGIDMTGVTVYNSKMTWDFVGRLRSLTRMRLLLKGIVTAEDARLCVEHGVDGVIVSNHGGRAEESGRGTIECLPEVVDAVGGRMPVLVDGGIRRGADIFKALALGARAVGVGRPYIWGLSAFGQAGVERVLDILRVELALVMRQCGARSIEEIRRSMILTV